MIYSEVYLFYFFFYNDIMNFDINDDAIYISCKRRSILLITIV